MYFEIKEEENTSGNGGSEGSKPILASEARRTRALLPWIRHEGVDVPRVSFSIFGESIVRNDNPRMLHGVWHEGMPGGNRKGREWSGGKGGGKEKTILK